MRSLAGEAAYAIHIFFGETTENFNRFLKMIFFTLRMDCGGGRVKSLHYPYAR